MNININDMDIHKLNILLRKFDSKFRYKNGNKKTIRYNIDQIKDVYTKLCKYTNNENNFKMHLIIKFTLKNEDGIICLNLLLDNYQDLI